MDFHEVAALVIFFAVVLLTVLLVLVPVSIPLLASWQQHLRMKSVRISYAAVPAVGTLAMLMTGVLNGSSLAAGIAGDDSMKPYGIVILFMALAYMSASLDMTGCFQWLALHLTRMSRGNGLALFLLYYTLSSVITIFTSNDVSIMTLTPIIYYFSLATGADPIPFLTAEFTAANIWSMLLFVGNPTNIIVAMAYRLSFLEYTKWMALPTIGAGGVALLAVGVAHWRNIPRHLELPDLHPSGMLVDKPGAMLGAVNILACLGFLAAAPALKWELWVVTLVCAVLHALYNFVAHVVFKGRWCSTSSCATGHDAGHWQATQPGGVPGAAAVPHTSPPLAAAQPADVELATRAADASAGAAGAAGAGLSTGHSQQQQAGQPPPADAIHRGGCKRVGSNSGSGSGSQQSMVEHAACSVGGGARGAPAAGDAKLYAGDSADVEVSIRDPSKCSCSRTCSRQQLLTAEQHAAGSYAATGRSPQLTASSSKGCCQEVLTEQCCCDGKIRPGDSDHDTASAEAAGEANGCRPGLQPPPAPNFWRAVAVLPWEIVPFVLGMFCVVEGLNTNGWVDVLARWLAAGLGGSVWGALFGVGWLSLLMANFINNQPMTILMTRVCMSPAFTQPLAAAAAAAGGGSTAGIPLASALAVVVASNTAANFSVMGALAGIMFVNILQQRGMENLGYLTFSRLMLPAGIASTVVALLVLGAEFVSWRV